MEPSSEITELTSRAYAVLVSGEGDPAGLFADDEGVLAIGSDPDEWWEGRDRIASVFRAQGEAMRGSRVEGSAARAYAQGDVGWMADRPTSLYDMWWFPVLMASPNRTMDP